MEQQSPPAAAAVVAVSYKAALNRAKKRLTWSTKATSGTWPSTHAEGWKPETMKAPVLSAFAFASLLIAALLEVLAQQSRLAGGLSLVDDAESLPLAVSFGYLYLPTVVAVLYSLAWNWIDLDVKRMQPWMELSKPDGALGDDSLFLDYPFDFVAFVPFKAAKRKHWAVFYAGTVVVAIFWVLTPLQSAVFGTGEVLVKRPTSMNLPSQLMPPLAQATHLDQAVLNDGYAITWLRQPYPPFTTSEYALLPFEPAATAAGDGPGAGSGSGPRPGGSGNWTGTTTKYWTELECWPAEVQKLSAYTTGGVANFLNGKGCNATEVVSHPTNTTPYHIQYIGYQSSAWSDYSLSSSTCNDDASHQFLASYSHYTDENDKIELSGAFCQTTYFKQKVSASVDTATRAPINDSITPLSPREVLKETEFNSSALEYLFGSGASSIDIPRDYPFTHLVEHYSRLKTAGLVYPLSPMVGFALGGQNYTVAEYKNLTVLSGAFKAAHQSLFSIAFHRLLVNGTTTTHSDGYVHAPKYGVIVSRVFSAVAECVLCVVATLTLLLLWTCVKAPSMLGCDPASLGSLIDVIKDSDDLLDKFSGKGSVSSEDLKSQLGHYRFRLVHCQDAVGYNTIAIRVADSVPCDGGKDETSSLDMPLLYDGGHYLPVRPKALRKEAGVAFLLFLCTGLIVLSYLKQREVALGGLTQPSSNFEVNLILTSFLPTAFSTVVEPFWVLLNRFLCILQPFYDLRSNQGIEQKSIKARYTAAPPQLAAWRATNSGHYLLAAVSVVALLANVLSVGLGGLFNASPARKMYSIELTPESHARFSEAGVEKFTQTLVSTVPRYEDPLYVAMANLSSGTSLPPWTSPEFFFLPVKIPSSAHNSAKLFQTTTTGISIDPMCFAAGPVTSKDQPSVIDAATGLPSGALKGCDTKYKAPTLFLNSTNYKLPQGPAAVEIVDTMSSYINNFTVSECDKTLIIGWSRANIIHHKATLNSSYVVCHPSFQSAQFRVSFDQSGYISDAVPVSKFEASLNYGNFSNHFDTIINSVNHYLRNEETPWHNSTVTSEWFNYLLKLYTKNDDFVSPSSPLPDPIAMLKPVSAVYKMIFASFLSLNPDIFEQSNDPTKQPGAQIVSETRIYMSSAAFAISAAILVVYIFTTAVFYAHANRFFLPRMPTTIGSLLAYVAPSSLVREYSDTMPLKSRAFGFGRYIGEDGRAQVGIEFSDRVVPVCISSLKKGETAPVHSKFRRLWQGSRMKKRGQTWL